MYKKRYLGDMVIIIIKLNPVTNSLYAIIFYTFDFPSRCGRLDRLGRCGVGSPGVMATVGVWADPCARPSLAALYAHEAT